MENMTKEEWEKQLIEFTYQDPMREFIEAAKDEGRELTSEFIQEHIIDFIRENMEIQALRGEGQDELVEDEIKPGDVMFVQW
jgi:hypothetical protein